MNHSDTLFLAVALGVGFAVGVVGSSHYGKIGFALGFVGGVASVFILLAVILAALPRRSKGKLPKGVNTKSE